MNIIVCVKQVPDSDKVTIDRETNRLNRTGVPSVINPFDENAIEMALQLKDQHGGKVTVVTMGPPQAEQVLRDCIALGVDDVVLVSDRKFGGADTWATSYTLQLAIRKIGLYDLVLFGKQAIDGDTAQVGPGVAYFLDLPLMTFVKEVEKTATGFSAKCVTEDGYEVWDIQSPAAMTVVKEANSLRMQSLRGKMKAKTVIIPVWGVTELNPEDEKIGLKGSPTRVTKIFSPPVKMNREFIIGDSPADMVRSLIHKLKERKVL